MPGTGGTKTQDPTPPGAGGSLSPAMVVGVGASAGGVEALETLVAAIPADSGLAWVLVVHLPPEHDSRLAEVLQPHAHVPVRQVTEAVTLERDRIYVIPPRAGLETVGSRLQLTEPPRDEEERGPIDHFLRTLARSHDCRGAAVILTGTGTDGALGVKSIKEREGLVVAQDPAEAAYGDMPRGALATGLVDLVLPVVEIPEAIIAYARTRPNLDPRADGEDAPADGAPASPPLPDAADGLIDALLEEVRDRTGLDFERYRRSTLLRRVAHRMQLARTPELATYLARVRRDPAEARALADELLVTVTGFFRDPELFEALEREVVPRLFEGRGRHDSVRAWSVGCATGEEAYSLAMLLLEEAERRTDPPRVQLFATDLHERSLAVAREGLYPDTIAGDVSPDRLRRFFRQVPGGYRVRLEVRDLVVFAHHDLLTDPPYSHLDLVSCRNLLLYLLPDIQRRAIERLHYALDDGGALVLTRAEGLDSGDLFRPDREERAIHWRRAVPSPAITFRDPVETPDAGEADSEGVGSAAAQVRDHPDGRGAAEHGRHGAPLHYALLHQRLLAGEAPPSLLVEGDGRVVHLSERVGRYLVHPGGAPESRVQRLVRPELRPELVMALRDARASGAPRRSRPVTIRVDGEARRVVVHARPARGGEEKAGYLLVLFEEVAERAEGADDAGAGAGAESEQGWARSRLVELAQEHAETEEKLRAANEELESTNEELRSMVEELQAGEEELRSTNEELEATARESQRRADMLELLSSDLENLLVATEIGTLFLDDELRIVRYTPRIAHLFRARPQDRDRPISELRHRLDYDELLDDLRRVLGDGEAIEREVQDEEGRWYLARILPHWGAGGELDGVVAMFVDITTRRRLAEAEEESRIKSQFLSTMSHELRTPLTAVIGVADLLETEVLGAMTEKQKQSLARIKRSAWHLVRIIEEVLTFSRSEAGKEQVTLAEVDLAAVARDVVSMVEPAARGQEVDVRLEAGEGDLLIRSDGGKVRQIATNLVDNAVKFAATEVTVMLDVEEEWVELRVRDDGPGIPAERVDEIFQPFTQLDGTSTREQGGTGLGLTIAQRQARLLGGEIRVESELGQGSTFTLRLPRQAPRPEGEQG